MLVKVEVQTPKSSSEQVLNFISTRDASPPCINWPLLQALDLEHPIKSHTKDIAGISQTRCPGQRE